MVPTKNGFRPDYAVHPGSILYEHLEVSGISQAEFARRCGRSPKLISEILLGKAPVTPKTALQFEKVLGLDARVWLGIEAAYQLHRASEQGAKDLLESVAWAKTFPVKKLVHRGHFNLPDSETDAVDKLLAFFGVVSVDTWMAKYDLAQVAFRHSASFKTKWAALSAWLRLGELEAEQQQCAVYEEKQFMNATGEIRGLTKLPINESLETAQRLCNQAGVALVLIKPLSKTALSGAAWWLSSGEAVIQLSMRHKSNDHLWLSFFHEAAHILLHKKKDVFIDGIDKDQNEIELEADNWAANALVPRSEWKRFIEVPPHSKGEIREFAERQGLAPGIIVGMLQHSGCLPWSHFNDLKVKLEWADECN